MRMLTEAAVHPAWTSGIGRALSRKNLFRIGTDEACLAQDCNLVMYNGLALTNGYSAATAVWNSATWNWAAFAPCQLVASGAQASPMTLRSSQNPK